MNISVKSHSFVQGRCYKGSSSFRLSLKLFSQGIKLKLQSLVSKYFKIYISQNRITSDRCFSLATCIPYILLSPHLTKCSLRSLCVYLLHSIKHKSIIIHTAFNMHPCENTESAYIVLSSARLLQFRF